MTQVAVHHDPVWREHADFIIRVEIDPEGTDVTTEQLWARRTGPNTFELCCIPFFVYDLALGDVVAVDSEFFITRVVQTSKRYAFRVHFGHDDSEIRTSVAERLEGFGALLEWSSRSLLAVDVIDRERAQVVADYLQSEMDQGHLIYETGRTEHVD